MKNILYYHKGNIVQAPLEAILSLFVYHFFICFSGFFIKEKLLEDNAGIY